MSASPPRSVHPVGDTGLETERQYSTSDDPAASAAPGAALGPNCDLIDPDLATVIEAWPTLPDAVRADILALVRDARPEPPAGTERP